MVTSIAAKVSITVFSRKDNDFCGYVRNDYLKVGCGFENSWEMISILESMFNKLSFPQSFVTDKRFSNKNKNKREINFKDIGEEMTNKEKKAKAKFIVSVQYRQNATWQGTIQWVEKNKSQNFRSTLELLKLMDEAIAEGEDGNEAKVSFENDEE